MKTKLYITCALAGVLAFAPLVGCAGNNAASESASQSAEQSQDSGDSSASEHIAGGWTVYEEPTVVLTDDEREIFQKASVGYTGVDLEPITVLATQVVAGMNYAYLCKAATVTADPVTNLAIVVVYNDLEGNATITSVKDIDLTDLKTLESVENKGNVAGGWEVSAPSNAIILPAEANEAFSKAAENYEDEVLTPMALLATQVVSGTNYKILCQGTVPGSDARPALYIVDLYADLQGNAEFTSVSAFDLHAYV
ncbi:MAG: hypothetical protein Q4A07_13275 [Coriobacteriales bacterium]|nr:hypothetical protein [Coriobacteriales bacterium]